MEHLLMRAIRNAAFWLICLLTLSACVGAKPVFTLESLPRASALTISMTEQDAQAILFSWAGSSQPATFVSPQLNLIDGGLTIRTQVRESSGKLVPANATAQVAARNGWFTLVVTAFEYGGYTPSAAELAKINRDIQAGLEKSRKENLGRFSVDALTITDNSLQLKFSAPTPSGLNAVFQLETDDQYNYLTVNFSARDVRALLNSIFAAGERPWFLNPVIALGNGQISISGNLLDGNTNKTTPISLSLGLTAQNGRLILSIGSLSLGGYAVPVEWLQNINKEIANAALRTQGTVSIEKFIVTPNGISIRLRLPR
jgi:hypothetical protein